MRNTSVTLNHVILELLKLDIEPTKAKICAEKVVISNEEHTKDIPSLVKEAYMLALEGGQIKDVKAKISPKKVKLQPKYQENDIRVIIENAKKNQKPAFENLQLAGIIKDPLEFLSPE